MIVIDGMLLLIYWLLAIFCIFLFFSTEINGFTDDPYGTVNSAETITSLGPLWNFSPGHQDAHELFHVFLSALQAELQTSCRVSRNTLSCLKNS